MENKAHFVPLICPRKVQYKFVWLIFDIAMPTVKYIFLLIVYLLTIPLNYPTALLCSDLHTTLPTYNHLSLLRIAMPLMILLVMVVFEANSS